MHKFCHSSTLFIATRSQASKKAMLEQNLNDKLKVSNAEILAFSYTCKLHRYLLASCLIYSYTFKEYISSFGCWSNGRVLFRDVTFSEIRRRKGAIFHSGFWLVPTSMTLNDLERRNSPYFAFFPSNSTDFQADHITMEWLKINL